MSRRLLPALALIATLIAAGCGTPPDKELQQAQTAIDAARAAGADRFAVEEYTAAQDLLTKARDAITQRDYRLALNHALDARERAQNAARDATGRMAEAKRDAETALADAATALGGANAALKTAETARVPRPVLTKAREGVADAETAVQEARTAASRGDYRGAIDVSTKATATLRQISKDLQAAAPQPAQRRRSTPRRS
jgi:hypothetical protein